MTTFYWPRLIILLIFLAVLTIPTLFWADSLAWRLGQISFYALFPLLGLLAFSLMWLQIVAVTLADFLRRFQFDSEQFGQKSGLWVLALIIAHPLLLALAQWQSGFGLPPKSYYAYPSAANQVFITYALIAWSIFILTDVINRLVATKKLEPYSRAIAVVNYFGFFLVFWHSLNLGSHLQAGLRPLWWFYGLSALGLITYDAFKKRALGQKKPKYSIMGL